jgi:8-oxo-dGTP pyrophosphatase MutT (NUDIX family)
MTNNDRFSTDQSRFAEWARFARESGERPAIPAATVVVLRDRDDGLETLMLRKNSKIAFGGMWVFPGGRIDDDDHDGEVATDGEALITAAKRAAVREAEEEAALRVEPHELVLFAHWIPPAIAPKRYATWFFAAATDADDVIIDHGEIVEGEWMTPAGALERHHGGDIELAPPTWVTLSTLAAFSDSTEALRVLDERPARHHATRISLTDDGPIAMWEGDAGYEASDASAAGARHRLEMFESAYRYDDSGAPTS